MCGSVHPGAVIDEGCVGGESAVDVAGEQFLVSEHAPDFEYFWAWQAPPKLCSRLSATG